MFSKLSLGGTLVSIGTTVTLFVAIKFILLRYGLDFPASGIVVFALSVGLGIALARSLTPAPVPVSRLDLLLCTIIIAAFGVLVGFEFRGSFILPAHDPIAVPAFAQIVADGELPMSVYRLGDSGFTYPPGYAVLLSPLFSFVSPLRFLFIFKLINLFVVVVTPAVWAWGIARLFSVTMRPWHMVVVAYLVFFGLERTLPFALPFAGKNAMLLAGLLFPIVLVALLESARLSWQFVVSALAFFGLALIHFSVLHMAAALIAGYLLVQFSTFVRQPGRILLLAVAGAAVAAGLLITLQDVVRDPRAAGLGLPNLREGLPLVFEAFTAQNSPLLVIYSMAPPFSVQGSPYRGPVLILCLALCLIAPLFAPKDPALRNIRRAASAFFIAILLSAAFAYKIIPAGIQDDFVRWFLFFFQAALMTSAGLTLCLMLQSSGWVRYVGAAASVVLVALGLNLLIKDTVRYRDWNISQSVTKADLMQAATAIGNAAQGRECLIVSESIGVMDDFAIFQLSKPLEYIEYLTRCTFVNGSYLHRSQADARSLEGLPPPSVLASQPKTAAILLLASPARQEAYAGQLQAAGRSFTFAPKGTAGGLGLWEIQP